MEKASSGCCAMFFLLASVLVFWRVAQSNSAGDNPIIDGVPAPQPLREHSKEFIPAEVIKVTEGVYVAVGFTIANSILLEGPDGLVIVDTTENETLAGDILKEFRKISSKPIKAIIFTHNHADHVKGARAFIEDPDNPPDIIGHELLPGQHYKTATTSGHTFKYAMHQFGNPLDDEARINAGIGLINQQPIGKAAYITLPSILIQKDGQRMNIAGLRLMFVHIPGETPDQMAVWLPDKKVLLPGDNVYKTFPNLYAIRGAPPRDVQIWANSLIKMKTLRAEYMVPSHTRPVSGEREIAEILNTYSNGIQFVHDQTVRHINKNIHPEEIAKMVKLPKQLATHRYLMEFYGTVEWSVKSVYTQYLGWFSGDPVELHPLTPLKKAEKMVELVGSKVLLEKAKDAVREEEFQWALELSSYVFKVEPNNSKALNLRTQALRGMASMQMSPNGRHFYLTAALDDHGKIDWSVDRSEVLTHNPVGNLLRAMRTRLKAEEVEGKKTAVVFIFTDVGETYYLLLEDSVLRVNRMQLIPKDVDITVTTTAATWKEILLHKTHLHAAHASGKLQVDGGIKPLRKFLAYFET